MKTNALATTALVLLALASPAFARDVTGDDAASAANRAPLADVSRVTVFSVSNDSGILLHRNPDLAANPQIAAAITRAGYTGSEIIGYNVDGSSLTVYVKSA